MLHLWGGVPPSLLLGRQLWQVLLLLALLVLLVLLQLLLLTQPCMLAPSSRLGLLLLAPLQAEQQVQARQGLPRGAHLAACGGGHALRENLPPGGCIRGLGGSLSY